MFLGNLSYRFMSSDISPRLNPDPKAAVCVCYVVCACAHVVLITHNYTAYAS